MESLPDGWNGIFPIPNINYIALPSDIDFYKILISKIGEDETITLLNELRDAGFTFNINQDKITQALIETEIFKTSLLRESGANKAYLDGYLIFQNIHAEIRDFQLNILSKNGGVNKIPFKFESTLLPYDINVIIGPNGIGKSHCLKSLVEYWLQIGMGEQRILEKSKHIPFDERPNISKLVLVSYSPFEEFSLDLEKDNLQDKKAYQYFGFRQMRDNGRIGISRNLPALNSSESLLEMISDDEKYKFIENRINKLNSVDSALKSAISYDYCVLRLSPEDNSSYLGTDIVIIDDEKYLPAVNIVKWVDHLGKVRISRSFLPKLTR
ncbi:hypothetical protein MRO53_24565 [Escherichia coli]|nr:hypothetical protein [Escherichia coli]